MTRYQYFSATIAAVLALLINASIIESSLAATYKCTENGKVTFSDRPCKTASSDMKDISRSGSSLSNGMHASWFANPEFVKDQVSCKATTCVCGDVESEFSDTGIAVINAMAALPNAWANHYSSSRRYKDMGSDRKRFSALLENLNKSACRIKISQKVILTHYSEYSETANAEFYLTDKAVEARREKCDAMLKGVQTHENKTRAMSEYKKECSIKKHNEMVRAHKRSKPMVKQLQKSLKTLQQSRSAYLKQRNANKR